MFVITHLLPVLKTAWYATRLVTDQGLLWLVRLCHPHRPQLWFQQLRINNCRSPQGLVGFKLAVKRRCRSPSSSHSRMRASSYCWSSLCNTFMSYPSDNFGSRLISSVGLDFDCNTSKEAVEVREAAWFFLLWGLIFLNMVLPTDAVRPRGIQATQWNVHG